MAAAKTWSPTSIIRSTKHSSAYSGNSFTATRVIRGDQNRFTNSKNHPPLAPSASLRKDDHTQQLIKKSSRKGPRAPRRQLVAISTSDGKWHGEWIEDYVFTLRELHLSDLAEDGQKDSEVFITLTIQKHAGFGLSVHGRIRISFNRKCWNCSISYCREIDTSFNVWVLPSSRTSHEFQLPEIGGDDPSVIYVKPGAEADFDQLIRDTIRLATSIKETCSESCEKAPPIPYYIGGQQASVDKRWSRLLELRNAI